MSTKSCYTVAYDLAEEFRNEGWRVRLLHNRIKISNDGVVISIAHGDSDPVIRVRTEDGGYSEASQRWSSHWTPREKVMAAWGAALDWFKQAPNKPIGRSRIKDDLCNPYGFTDLEMVSEDGWYEMHKTIRKCRVIDILAIGENLKLIPAEQPGHDPMYLMDCVSEYGKRFKILTDGKAFYPVTKKSIPIAVYPLLLGCFI